MTDTNTNTKTIARNSGWFSIENINNSIVTLVASILINRYLGPNRNSYIIFVSQIAAMASGLGGFGIPATTKKYMAEFIGMGDRGTARYIYWRTLAIQVVLATLAAGSLLLWVLKSATGDYKLASALIVLSIWPAMVNSISSQANQAAEDFFSNVPASILSNFTYLSLISATVFLNWGVIGVGRALLAMRIVDFVVRFFPTVNRVLGWKTTHPHPLGLARRMAPFAGQNLISTAVAMVVWGRSEVLLLEYFNADKSQVSFYSVAFTMAEMLLLVATIFGSAAGATIFAQFGRDKSKLPDLAASIFRYIALMTIPLHFIAASLASSALIVVYGDKFVGAAMVVAVAPLLCIFKAFLMPAQNLLESMERQRYVIGATAFAGVIDLGVAWYFIPLHGAVGACIGNGAGQLLAVGIMWAICARLYGVKLPWKLVAKLIFISTLASWTAHLIAERLSPLWAVLCGGSAALVVLFTLVYGLRVLEPEDQMRFKQLVGMMPGPIANFTAKIFALLIRPEFGNGIKNRSYPLPEEKGPVVSEIWTIYRRLLSNSVRQQIYYYRETTKGVALKLKLTSIPVSACLRGGDSGVRAAAFARLIGDLRYPSQHISEWPHVKLLQQYDAIGERIWDEGVFEKTEYYKNAVRNIELFGNYFDAVGPHQIRRGACRFILSHQGMDASEDCPDMGGYVRKSFEHIAVYPISDSAYFQVSEGHHRLAKAYVSGVKEVSGLILRPPVTTPLQDLLHEVLWLKGRCELYQPIESPEVAQWTVVRRCSDRQAKIEAFLRTEGLTPPNCRSCLDVASSYGWFVAAMSKAGFHAEGVERDPNAILVGTLMYGLKQEQLHRADAVTFLQGLQSRYDVTTCFSLAHHYVMNNLNASAEELLRLLDSATRCVLFFETGESREYPGSRLEGWDADYIHQWLESNTTFKRIVRLGVDEDRVAPDMNSFGRMLFACVR